MEILQGIVIGVFSGLTLGGLAWIRNRFVRCEEIRYIRKLIIEERKKIYTTTALQIPSSPIPVSADQIRVTLYQYMRSELTSALKERASQLSFDEKRSITIRFTVPDLVLAQPEKDGKKKIPPLKAYMMMFSEWEKQKWLNLPAHEGEIPEQ